MGGSAQAMDDIRFSAGSDSDAGSLMASLLGSLLDDFDSWFRRGEELLLDCPDCVMAETERLELGARLSEGTKAITAARSLLSASKQPLAVSMQAMSRWHHLMTEVWSLSARFAEERRRQAPS